MAPVISNFFTDVIQKDPRFNSVQQINDPLLLEPVTRDAVFDIIGKAKGMGITIVIGETYRSQTRQKLLFNKGKSELSQVGVHHFGLAADLWIEHNGQVDWHADYSIINKLCRAHPLICGADWGEPGRKHTFLDIDHVQRVTLGRQNALFAGRWYPETSYDPRKELGIL